MSYVAKIKAFLSSFNKPEEVDNGKEKCPKCGGESFTFGPEGGGSQNVQCNTCLTYWNYMGPFGFQEIGDRSDVFGIKKQEDDK